MHDDELFTYVRACQAAAGAWPFRTRSENAGQVVSLIRSMPRPASNPDTYVLAAALTSVACGVLSLTHQSRLPFSPAEPEIDQVLRAMWSAYTRRDLTLGLVGSRIGRTPFHISRLVSEATGHTFRRHIICWRVLG